MKTLLIFTITALAFLNSIAQTSNPNNHNYIRTETFQASVKDDNNIPLMPLENRTVRYEYFNGLGSVSQIIDVGQTPLMRDLITFKIYDSYGREMKNYLPYSSSGSGNFRLNPMPEQLKFYSEANKVAKDSEPFLINEFKSIPAGQVHRSFAPGWNWHADLDSRPVIENTDFNRASEVLMLSIGNDALISYTAGLFYPENRLVVSEQTDENGLITREYMNFKNQLVLKRVGDGGNWNDTYTLYDIAGRVSYIIPPEATHRLNEYASATDKQGFIDRWCFQYKYDQYGRNTHKRIPGSGWVYMLYDRWDRLILQQDANQRKSNKWLFNKYDIHNRVIMTGFVTGYQENIQTSLMANLNRYETPASNSIGYTNNCFPSHNESMLQTITYYDCYNFTAYPGWDNEGLKFTPFVADGLLNIPAIFNRGDITKVTDPVVRGYATGSKVKVLGQEKWLNSVTYYDRKYRIVQTISENQPGLVDIVSIQYNDLTGKPVKRRTTHHGSTVINVTEEYTYDQAQRLIRVHHQVNNQPKILLVQNSYNELGQLVERNFHSQDGVKFLQSVDMRYNIQGWLTSINNSSLTNDAQLNDDTGDLFGMELQYHNPISINNGALTPIKLYNGNVSSLKWKTDTRMTIPVEKIYGFGYDHLGRFKQAYFATLKNGTWTGDPGLFNERVNTYDRNGNIGGSITPSTGIIRSGLVNVDKADIDNLLYRYNGNRLMHVKDNAISNVGFKDKPGVDVSLDEYTYDDNGNLVEDFNKSVTRITYNHLNLPEVIEITRVEMSPNRIDRIEYNYDATGRKLTRKVWLGGQKVWETSYVGSLQYDNGKVSFFETPEGRAVWTGSGFEYEYFLKDHQNNVRVVYGQMKETKSYKATMELSLETKEKGQYGFRNISEARVVGNNFTPAGEANIPVTLYSARCNGFADGTVSSYPVGPAKTLKVSAGDVIYTEVFARYNQVKTLPNTVTASVLAASVASAFGITKIENPVLWQEINANAPLVSSRLSPSTVIPKAYLALLYFDINNVFKRAAVSGITESAYRSFEKLTLSFTPDVEGHVFIYVVNEANSSALLDVYFDDLYIVHQNNSEKLQVLQASDYYPFGLPYNQFSSERLKSIENGGVKSYEPVVQNRYLFQGQEIQKDLNLDWYNYKYRMHDPAVGRFFVTDPLAEDYAYNSPYAFSENKLMHGVELEGLEFSQIFESVKYYSPIAIKPSFSFTSHDTKIGIDVSVGLPKLLPFSHRMSFGYTMHATDLLTKRTINESRTSTETSRMNGLLSFESTHYTTYGSQPTSQTTGMVTIGGPFLNIKYENDWHPDIAMQIIDPLGFHPRNGGDGDDRYRTAAMQVNFGLLKAGFNLGTGNPYKFAYDKSLGGSKGTFVSTSIYGINYDPDKYRLGIGYIGIGTFRIGTNSEELRHLIQNRLVHDNIGSPRFLKMPISPQFYYGFTSESSTLW